MTMVHVQYDDDTRQLKILQEGVTDSPEGGHTYLLAVFELAGGTEFEWIDFRSESQLN